MGAFREVTAAIAQVATAVGAIAGATSKGVIALDRMADAALNTADSFVKTNELRNTSAFQDAILDEEERELERAIRRSKLAKAMAKVTP